MKGAVDIIGSALLLLLTAPLIAICGLLVRLQDGGPAIHRRRVIGRYGEFDAFKLRTMRPDADEVLTRDPWLRQRFEINFKLKDDPRVTRFGAFLRRSCLDELPQLWNVLRGEMSLVGPRMISTQELARYGDASWIFKVMKPGLTGHWQVNGWAAVEYEQRVAMDRWYVENWSLLTDLTILFKTPLRVLRGKGRF
ncbi:MAG TPA: sugar transferase [Terriglobales bacterium]|nr:sugar transferase [Terriglobales bacterium]